MISNISFPLIGQTHSPLHTCTHVFSQTHNIPAYIYILAHIHFYILSDTHMLSHTHTHTYTLVILTHSQFSNAHTHTFSHTYLHTNSNALPWLQPNLSSVLPGTTPDCWSEDTLAQGFLGCIRPILLSPFSGPPLYA